MPQPKQTNKQITLLETCSKRNNYIPHPKSANPSQIYYSRKLCPTTLVASTLIILMSQMLTFSKKHQMKNYEEKYGVFKNTILLNECFN